MFNDFLMFNLADVDQISLIQAWIFLIELYKVVDKKLLKTHKMRYDKFAFV